MYCFVIENTVICGILFSILLFIQSSAQFSSIVVTGSYPMTLPRPSGAMAVGYDSNNDTILLVGGVEGGTNQFVTFKNSQFVDHGSDYLPQGFDGYILFGWGQFYSQMGSTLWMLNAMTWEKITPFDVNTWSVNDPSITIPEYAESGDSACLASLNNGYNKYLLVVGAWPGNTNDNYLSLIYNISASAWLNQTNIPTLNDNRYAVSCIVHNDRLYAIGGGEVEPELDTVESLYIGDDLIHIKSESWQYTINKLSSQMGQTRAVVYGDNVFVIPCNDLTDVNIINTLTNRISVGGTLTNSYSARWVSAAIIVNHILCMFGGSTVDYQCIDLQSIAPTSPTIPTTKRPSSDTSSTTPTKSATGSGNITYELVQTIDISNSISKQISVNLFIVCVVSYVGFSFVLF